LLDDRLPEYPSLVVEVIRWESLDAMVLGAELMHGSKHGVVQVECKGIKIKFAVALLGDEEPLDIGFD
jgi:hypothetical protein